MNKSKRVSILKETRGGEKRVIIQPDHLGPFRERGFEILVERDAGTASGCPDSAYEAAGARIVSTEEAWNESDFVLKYKAPGPAEHRFFRPGMHLGSFMHAEGNPALTEAIRASGMTAYALEFYESASGITPLCTSDNEIAGKMAVVYAAYFLQSHLGGNGVFLPRVPGAKPARVLVLGYGNAGGGAARLAAEMGCEVTVLGTRPEGLRRFEATVPRGVRCLVNTPETLRAELAEADLVVGAILISTFDTPAMIGEDMLATMKPGAMIVDVTCGYGPGYLPSFDRQTVHEDPVYIRHGILHCKIDAMPASFPTTAAEATSSNVAGYLADLGERIYEGNPATAPGIKDGMIVSDYKVVHPEVIRHLDMQQAGAA
jgi:alanine dehydrogenase